MSVKSTVSLDQKALEHVAHGLSQILADTYLTYIKTQNFHWNVIDSRFHSLHVMFEEQYKELAEGVDEIAERIRMLKFRSPGSMREFLELSTLDEADNNLSGNEMLQDLCHARETLIQHIRPRIEESAKAGDEGTADMLIQHLRMHEKAAWMLRSHLGERE